MGSVQSSRNRVAPQVTIPQNENKLKEIEEKMQRLEKENEAIATEIQEYKKTRSSYQGSHHIKKLKKKKKRIENEIEQLYKAIDSSTKEELDYANGVSEWIKGVDWIKGICKKLQSRQDTNKINTRRIFVRSAQSTT